MSAGIAAARWLEQTAKQLAAFEPVELREQVTSPWARQTDVQTEEKANSPVKDQMSAGSRGRRAPERVEEVGEDPRRTLHDAEHLLKLGMKSRQRNAPPD